jgi:D-glycero-D-manno-heptose 1,7-bisphosphate phosphatase
MKARAAFIDRDGVINEERNYVHRIDDFVLLPGVIEGLALLRRAGFHLVVVTNQAGIARGYYGPAELERLHAHLADLLAAHGLRFDAIYHCPHHPQGSTPELAVECDCRKPAPGMLLQAAREFDLDLSSSVLIGDKLSDIQAGRAAGVGRTVVVESGHALEPEARSLADFTAAGLLEAARLLTAADICAPA